MTVKKRPATKNTRLEAPQEKSTDPDRITAINKLIPQAEKNAKRLVKEHGKEFEYRQGRGQSYRHSFFVQFYHQEMNRLAQEAGLR